MRRDEPEKAVAGRCPTCGDSRINIVLEGACTFFMSGPNEYAAWWVGRCSRCHAYLESYHSDEEDIDALPWDFVEEEKMDFLRDGPEFDRATSQPDP